jgi:hypothetical protein
VPAPTHFRILDARDIILGLLGIVVAGPAPRGPVCRRV